MDHHLRMVDKSLAERFTCHPNIGGYEPGFRDTLKTNPEVQIRSQPQNLAIHITVVFFLHLQLASSLAPAPFYICGASDTKRERERRDFVMGCFPCAGKNDSVSKNMGMRNSDREKKKKKKSNDRVVSGVSSLYSILINVVKHSYI